MWPWLVSGAGVPWQKWILWFDSGRVSKDGPRGRVSSGHPLLIYWIFGNQQLKSTSVTGPAGQPPIHNLVLSDSAEERLLALGKSLLCTIVTPFCGWRHNSRVQLLGILRTKRGLEGLQFGWLPLLFVSPLPQPYLFVTL